MTPPEKCETRRRAEIIMYDLAHDKEQLSDETPVLYERFDPIYWMWVVTVEHPVLPSLPPGCFSVRYANVYAFNKMIDSQIAKAIAGEETQREAVGFQPPSLGLQQQQLHQLQQQQLHQLQQQQQQNITGPSFWPTANW